MTLASHASLPWIFYSQGQWGKWSLSWTLLTNVKKTVPVWPQDRNHWCQWIFIKHLYVTGAYGSIESRAKCTQTHRAGINPSPPWDHHQLLQTACSAGVWETEQCLQCKESDPPNPYEPCQKATAVVEALGKIYSSIKLDMDLFFINTHEGNRHWR